ncbi:hypothetical protein [Altibacter sp. HG106]|uniref:hypothetical protein n=1 Tax=Altibacter sp. HG106 TaxID=3023937 RepID=UPI0023509056|nr:hypothetical protein [Altibacter sp. HG106]MDC7993655.1 hypothetical protein [Altibacter sp. HG106]
MKNLSIVCFLAIGVLFSCSTEESAPIDTQEANFTRTAFDEFCYETPLIAGKHTEVGRVQVVYTNGEVQVQYVTDGDWILEETHLFAGACDDMPVNGGGNPKIGKFPLHGNHSGSTQTVAYGLDTSDFPECICVAAHAVVRNAASNQRETAWGDGITFPGRSWAMYFNFCWDACDGD